MTAGSDTIATAARQLVAEWGQTRQEWRDQTAHLFQENHLQPLLDDTHAFLLALDRLEQTLSALDGLDL